ncbi:hypothetical protein H5410_015743 [Solanum commersonii]|uniref:DUF4371 domain-containing protein n=1 Tax=Solanum commersonii TaxID=4109 RepID=A0A9J5ZVF1_SOLCO|nr:hypothetical protein H5410_015743 [Solanum commersonii]
MWFDEYRNWLEYSIDADATYCLSWDLQIGIERIGFLHILVNGIAFSINLKESLKILCENNNPSKPHFASWMIKTFLNQGFAFRGYDESESLLNKVNFLEVISSYASRCDAIKTFVLEKNPKNNKMTSHDIQKDIVTACKIEPIKAIIEDINSDYFSLLVDESRDVSRKEQMAICLRYVDKRGFVMEAFIGLVHIKDTSDLSLKEAIVYVLAHHFLTLSNVRGKCYDGASNMQGDLKTLIR